MGLYVMEAPHTCLTTFMWSFFLTWVLAMIQGLDQMWILFLGLAVLFFHKMHPHYDFGAANIWGRWLGGITGQCDTGASHQEFGFKFLFQFLGAFVGGIFFNWIMDAAPAPYRTSPTMATGKVFVLFAFANFVQAYAANRLVATDTSLDNSFRLATGYMISWVLCQSTWMLSIGGVTIDFGRLLAGKITHSDQVVFDDFWILLLAPVVGWLVAGCYQWLEYSMAAKENGDAKKEEEPAADNNAEEQA